MSRAIQAIPTASVAKICSGQVILDLSTAVKELLENALDAGATSVEIRLREHGLQLIEVSSSCCALLYCCRLKERRILMHNQSLVKHASEHEVNN
jgi:hypothetical protein